MQKMAGRNIDMVHGSIGDKVLLFAVPLASTGILQQMFNAADIAVIGQFCGKNAMAAVGSNSPLIGLMVTFFIGISLGANVVISRFTGQKNEEGVCGAVHTAILMAVLCGIFMTIFGELAAPPVLRLLSVPAEIMDMATLYLRVYLLGMPVILLYNFESAIFRSQGDTRTPLISLFVSGIINVGLNVFFVVVLGMTVDGVAAATVISNAVSSALLFYFLVRSDTAIRVQRRKFHIHRHALKEILRIGIPAGLQSMVFSLSNICIQSAINSLGADVIAASAAAFNIEIFAYYIINSFGQACTTFVGQNYGAEQFDRCRRVTRICMIQDMLFTALIAGTIFFSGGFLLHLFNGDPAVISFGMIRMRYILSAELVNVVIEVLSGCLRGYGYSMIPAFLSLFGICGVRISWVYTIFRHIPTFDILMMVYPISWIVTACAITVSYLVLRKRMTGRQSAANP